MNLVIRLERKGDYREVENLTREAFWDIYQPGCVEHLLVHKIRSVPVFVKELDLVACDGDKIVGNIVYSKAMVVDERNRSHEILCVGPLSVLPPYQGRGIGSSLMRHSIKKAADLGYRALVLFGNPEYYHRFGFRNAKEFGIQTSQGENFEEFMALELSKDSLKGISGKFYEDAVFKIDEKELASFDTQFPYREKHVTPTQLK